MQSLSKQNFSHSDIWSDLEDHTKFWTHLQDQSKRFLSLEKFMQTRSQMCFRFRTKCDLFYQVIQYFNI